MTMPIEIPNLTDTQKSFNAMQTNLITVNSAVNVLQGQYTDHEGRLTDLEKVTIIGDQEPSLREQVRATRQFVDAIKKIGWIVGGAILAQTIAFGTAVAVAYFKYLPVLERLANQP